MTTTSSGSARARTTPLIAAAGVLAVVGAGLATGALRPTDAPAPGATTATTTTLSATAAGVVGNGRSSLVDARPGLVALDSTATNLDPAATSGAQQSYVKATSGALTLVSASGGTAAAKGSVGAGFSPDGSRVAFVARGGLTGTATGPQAYVRLLSSGAVTLLSGTGGAPLANHGLSLTPSGFSAAGTKVAFAVRDSSYGAGWQVLVADLTTGARTLASVGSAGQPVGPAGETPPTVAMAPDGSAVYFDSDTAKVLPGVAPGQVYRRDLAAGTTSVVSRDTSGAACKGSLDAVLTTGRVVFESGGACVPGTPKGKGNVFVTGATGTGTALVSATAGGPAADQLSTFSGASPDGGFVAVTSFATDLGVDGVVKSTPQLYVKNLTTGALTWVSRPPKGSLTGKNVGVSHEVEVADGGASVTWSTRGTNLLATSPSVPQSVLRRDLAGAATSLVSVSASGAAVLSSTTRVLDASHVAFSDDTAGQVLLRTLG